MLHDMIAIREFETMLNSIKTTGDWQGVEYNHPGPAHLSIGQEAAVRRPGRRARASTTSSSARTAATARSSPRGSPPIAKLDDGKLLAIMSDFLGGETLRCVEKIPAQTAGRAGRSTSSSYGTIAEIFARKTGFNRGLGGSMHAFFTPFGIYPNNAIVGGSAPHRPGRRAVQADQPQARHRRRQHRRRVHGLRSGLGGA